MTHHPLQESGSASTVLDSAPFPEPESPQSGATTPVLDHGFVGIEQFVGGDLNVVNSARVSYDTRHIVLEPGDAGLIGYLLKYRHGSPFEHSNFTFNVKLPIFVAREWIRHRIGSFNEVSMRYTKIVPEFYIPLASNVRQRVGKAGAYTYQPMPYEAAVDYVTNLREQSIEAAGWYNIYIGDGVAPEQARLFLPVNVYTQWYWTVNSRSLMNFLSLRNSPTAQWEIQQFAQVVETYFQRLMPITHDAFVENGRQAP